MKISCKSITLFILFLLGLSIPALAQENTVPKRTLKTNYQLNYLLTPSSVETLDAMFTEGMFYGRLRSNNFYFHWEGQDPTHTTHYISGFGGSLIFKSAIFSDFDFTVGLYTSQGIFDDAKNAVAHLKSGKDTLSRFDYVNTGRKSMVVLGEAYLHYGGLEDIDIHLGRQLVEAFYTKSNDTKMIPNTFDGLVLDTKEIPDTSIRFAYLTRQKLRDHTESHSILMYGDSNSSSAHNPQWSENDDAAMHDGLTYSRLTANGIDTDAALITGDMHNYSIAGLKLDASFYAVPELISQVMGEVNYQVSLSEKLSITPGIRYIRQFDNGAGEIGGASYLGHLAGKSGAVDGYKEADSLDSQMIAARLVAEYENYCINLGYSQVLDEADLITPWRSFPTAGYTRSMAQYNWRANTKSYRIVLRHNANQGGIYRRLFTEISFLHTDGDESKGWINSDHNYYYAGFVQNIPRIENLQWRLRVGYGDTELEELDSIDARFELNYLF